MSEIHYPVERSDFNIYTDLPKDYPLDYVKGYYICFTMLNDKHVGKCRNKIGKFINAYGIIIRTERAKRIRYTNIYIMFATKHEHDLYKCWGNNIANKLKVDCSYDDIPVYFHKMHIDLKYNPDFFSDPGTRYQLYIWLYCFEHNVQVTEIPDDYKIEKRKECMSLKGCYNPQEDSYLCKRNTIVCDTCILSVRYKDENQYKYFKKHRRKRETIEEYLSR